MWYVAVYVWPKRRIRWFAFPFEFLEIAMWEVTSITIVNETGEMYVVICAYIGKRVYVCPLRDVFYLSSRYSGTSDFMEEMSVNSSSFQVHMNL